MPPIVHDSIMKEFNRIIKLDNTHPEYFFLINHVSYVVNLPWNKVSTETLDFEKAKKVDDNHFFQIIIV